MSSLKSTPVEMRSLGSVIAESVATGALTLIDVTALSLRTRRTIAAGAAGMVGPVSGIVAHRSGTSALAAVGVGGAAAVGVYGGVTLSFWADRSMHCALARRGVKRPRVVMAVAAGALSFALAEANRQMEQKRTAAGCIESTEISLPPQEAP